MFRALAASSCVSRSPEDNRRRKASTRLPRSSSGMIETELVPFVRVKPRGAAFFIKPVDLILLEEENPPKHQLGNSLRVSLRVSERKGRAPGAAERHPLVDLGDLLPQLLDVVDEVPGRIVFDARIGRRLAAAALVEDEDLVLVRIELPPVIGARSAARTAVEEYDRLSVRIARELPIEAMPVTDVEHARLVRLDLGIERAAGLGGHVHQKLNSS